jgi:ribosome-binding factor A
MNRTAEDMKRELTVLMRDLKDPRVQGKMLTVVRVHLTADGASAKVYVSAMEGKSAAIEAVKGLQHAGGMLRGELARRLHMRKAPEIKFIADDSIEVGAQISRLIDQLVPKEKEEEDTPHDD